MVTAVIGLAVVLFALNPPDLLVWLNLFSFGGLESVFIWPIIFGLYWSKGNKYGAFISMIVGMGSYILFDRFSQMRLECIRCPTGTVIIDYICFGEFSYTRGEEENRRGD